MKKVTIIIFLFLAFGVSLGVYYVFNTKTQRTNLPPTVPLPFSETPPRREEKEKILRLSVVAENLEVVWDMAFLPEGSMLVTERVGRVRLIDKNGKLMPQPVATLGVKTIGEGGLHGIALHPDFSKSNYVYLYYTYGEEEGNTLNRVVRFVFDGQKFTNEKIIIDRIPGARFHNGGRVRFGPDGYLYITTGDAQNPSTSQDRNSLAGKILRVTDEGKTPPDNPFDNPVYSWGHRNPQGIAWDKEGRLWAVEHGDSAHDEINLIEKGKNYGWPEIEGNEEKEGMETPVAQSADETWAPAGLARVEGNLYFGGLRGNALYQAAVTGRSVEISEQLKGELGRIRSVVVGPDGMIYAGTSNKDGRGVPSANDDKIIRINPEKL